MEFTYDHVPPSDLRRRRCEGGLEKKFPEGAVQIAFALYLVNHPQGCVEAAMYPDGEHAKYCDIPALLGYHGFEKKIPLGATNYGGRYENGHKTIIVNPKSQHGRGDVVGKINERIVRAECKGGIINSTHSGAQSKMRSGFSELIGQTMAMTEDGGRHVAVLPETADTLVQARRLVTRCNKAGIEIALVKANGAVCFVVSDAPNWND
jgi:hypothetical protein